MMKIDPLLQLNNRFFKACKNGLKSNGMDVTITAFIVIIGMQIFFPYSAGAVLLGGARLPEGDELRMTIEAMQNVNRPHGSLPVAIDGKVREVVEVPMTAYSSDVWQTDDSPFITASNTHVRHGIVAANFLPIGTKVKIPALYGEEVFIVEDRMNRRYDVHMDIWMEETADARNFGLQFVDVEIYR